MTLRKTLLCFALSLALVVFCDLCLPRGEAEIYDSVIRLHVLANSDSEADQAIKLAVRDAILDAGIFNGESDINAAKASMESALKKAEALANARLASLGVPYTAKCVFSREHYPTRIYENKRLPAGTYMSVQVVLGKGEGQNWWCVLFPPFCIGTCEKPLTDSGEEVFNTGSRYSFRFKLLEWLFGR